MRRIATWTLSAALLAAMSAPAYAADWLILQSTERGREDQGVAVWGFAQLLGEAIVAEPVEGLLVAGASLASQNGRYASFNVLSGEDTRASFSVRRLRLGVRGAIPKTDQRVVYFVAAEYGQNAMTEADAVKLVDASVSFDLHEALRVRVGQFKLPLADESLESNPNTADLINLSNVTATLLHERPVAGGVVAPGATGTRDTGVQLSGSLRWDQLELAWAAGLSNGRAGALDDNNAKDLSARLQLAWLLDGAPLRAERDELAVYVWGLTGIRAANVRRTRLGGGVQWRWQQRWRLRAEGMWADGALILGPKPAFPGNARAFVEDGTAWGITGLAGFRPIPALELDLGANRLHTLPGEADARISWEQIAGVQWFAHPNAKVMLNGALRQTYAPRGSDDAKRILATQGPRISLQVTATF
jgi:hypothetical protein